VVAALAIPRRGGHLVEVGISEPEMVPADLVGEDRAGALVSLG
jgi:hypothetical protein